ncbi:uncharacterized protein PG998_000333 [Apiospora kogelbergensis]|uniref:uncharacterized protein n=1 Tax=Apiospora kogelbergensis TaxID=1337665 RepID=UPI00312E7A46
MSSSIPAWKRLGLTLKPASASSESHGDSNAAPATPSLNGAKRKPSGAPASDHSNKKLRTDNSTAHASPAHTPNKRPKSVSFAAETQTSSGTPTATHPKQKKASGPKPSKPLKPLVKKQSNVNLQPSVDYLRQWHKARDQWKFNKNHQTKLLENVFADGATIPAVDINLFYEYIRDLKGHVRTRLRESAQELKKEDIEQGAQVFANSSKEAAQRKQKEYEEVIAGFMREGQTPEKRRFEEVEYVLRTADMEMQRRVVKRMRAESVIEELSDGDESTTTTATTNTSASTETGADTDSKGTNGGAAEDNDGDKRLKLNDGSQQPAPKRKRKTRTAVVEDSSSSESDSDSDGDSSSSDESSSDEEEGAATTANQEEAESSSSSSSSSSDNDSDSDEEESDAE